MENKKYAKLNDDKLKELKDLEKKFGFTLVAFDTANKQATNEQNSP